MLDNKIFIDPRKIVDQSADIIFVADLFVEDYVGGAELTSEALIESSPLKVQKLHAKDVNLAALQQGHEKFWIFGNFSQLNPELIPTIIGNIKYSVLEYDFKFCRFRSPEKHEITTGSNCDCHNQMNGKLISAFYYGAAAIWWMSEKQKQKYLSLFPFLSEKDNIVLSSVFSHKTLGTLSLLRNSQLNSAKSGWIILGSQSWVKGFDQAKLWCDTNNKKYEIVWNLPYEELLTKLSMAEGFVYLPAGGDTCPRMVIEAKLLGCKLELNQNVLHANEEWFTSNDLDSINDYLYAAHNIFWTSIKKIIDYNPTISGYITTYNCITQGYPFEKSIKSMLQFCDEVCVIDGGSTDGTPETLFDLQLHSSPEDARVKLINDLKKQHGETLSISVLHEALNSISQVKVKTVSRDWTHPRHAVFDGMQKAEARKMCTSDFCWQMDSDEIVHESDVQKIKELCANMPKGIDIVSLPVVEYWGSNEKVRVDIQPWKWRLSRNESYITHGIPSDLRATDENGNVFAKEGTDGCDMIHVHTGERLPHITFHTQESENLRVEALRGNEKALRQYESWFNQIIENIPGVFHYSWFDIERKIKLYKSYWTNHWNSLYNKSMVDTADNNMMFDLPWEMVTEEMIINKATELKEKTGGWIWHRKWNGQKVPHIIVNKKEPLIGLNK